MRSLTALLVVLISLAANASDLRKGDYVLDKSSLALYRVLAWNNAGAIVLTGFDESVWQGGSRGVFDLPYRPDQIAGFADPGDLEKIIFQVKDSQYSVGDRVIYNEKKGRIWGFLKSGGLIIKPRWNRMIMLIARTPEQVAKVHMDSSRNLIGFCRILLRALGEPFF
jgi:hypothetical protein